MNAYHHATTISNIDDPPVTALSAFAEERKAGAGDVRRTMVRT